jgi:D-sedoheptulose 7-phosphate isomerase
MLSLKKIINDSTIAKYSLLNIEPKINIVISKIFKKLRKGGKIFLCGNGGSAADAQHLAAEFLVRLRPKVNRSPIPALSLAMDTSTITACGNDYLFEDIFSRNLEALAISKDVLLVISTSGNSKNILKVLKMAKKKKILSIGFFGKTGGKAKKICDLPLCVNSNITARIQESHILLGHYIFECVEDKILKKIK